MAGSGSTRPALQIPARRRACGTGLQEQRVPFTAHPAHGRRGEFLGCFHGLLPMHGQSWAPDNLLPLKALHSHPGWREVKEKATHTVKCKGGSENSPRAACPGLGARHRAPGSGRAAEPQPGRSATAINHGGGVSEGGNKGRGEMPRQLAGKERGGCTRGWRLRKASEPAQGVRGGPALPLPSPALSPWGTWGHGGS